MSDIVVSISTQVKPAKRMLLDGEEFHILGPDHLSPEDESIIMALFARHELLQRELANEPKETRGKAIADRIRECQERLFSKLTDIPRDRIAALKLTQKAELMEAIERIVTAENEDEEYTPAKAQQEAAKDAAEVEERFGGSAL
jgi:hypothetical protein